MYIYQGNDRRNLTSVIEANVSATSGAPFRINYGNEALVVLQVNAPARDGQVQFSYKMMGQKYKWFEYPFVGIWGSLVWYWITMVLILIALLIVVSSPIAVPLSALVLVGGAGAFLLCSSGITFALCGSICGGSTFISSVCCCCCCCCRRRGKAKRKGPARRNDRRANSRFFSGGRKDGVQVFSPGGKKAAPPALLRRQTTGKKQSP